MLRFYRGEGGYSIDFDKYLIGDWQLRWNDVKIVVLCLHMKFIDESFCL